MKIASIIGSTSHVQYIGRLTALEPGRDTLGLFVSMSVGNDTYVGIVSDSRLTDPALYRLAPSSELESPLGDLSADLQRNENVLIAIQLLGKLRNASGIQEVPSSIIPKGTEILEMSDSSIASFHRNEDGELSLSYFSDLNRRDGSLGTTLTKLAIRRVESLCSEEEKRQLNVIKRSIAWKSSQIENSY